MKVYRLPRKISTLLFDMDLTLYTNPEYGQCQIDRLMEKLALVRGVPFEDMKAEIGEKRKAWAISHNGKKPSLSNILGLYGIGMEENINWRKEICDPEKFIGEDKRLAGTLKKLSSFFKLGVVTNNPVSVAAKTLSVLGVADYFPVIVGLDTCMIPKPDKKPFVKFTEISGCRHETCVSIGDRYDIDLDVPLEMGMGGILVDGVEDVYILDEVLLKKDINRAV